MEIWIGIVGAAIMLIAFTLNEIHVWNQDNLAYDAANLIGAILLVWYAWTLSSLPFGILNGIWALVALRDLVLGLKNGKKKNDTIIS